MRIPLCNYDGVGLREAATESERLGWLRVADPPGTTVQDGLMRFPGKG